MTQTRGIEHMLPADYLAISPGRRAPDQAPSLSFKRRVRIGTLASALTFGASVGIYAYPDAKPAQQGVQSGIDNAVLNQEQNTTPQVSELDHAVAERMRLGYLVRERMESCTPLPAFYGTVEFETGTQRREIKNPILLNRSEAAANQTDETVRQPYAIAGFTFSDVDGIRPDIRTYTDGSNYTFYPTTALGEGQGVTITGNELSNPMPANMMYVQMCELGANESGAVFGNYPLKATNGIEVGVSRPLDT